MAHIFIFLSGLSFGCFVTVMKINLIIDSSLNELGMLLFAGVGVMALLFGIQGINKDKRNPKPPKTEK
ncbi:MAG: hypothetical protein Q8O83_03600 [bacterium]|nr:hypothetical protein [bacterium]